MLDSYACGECGKAFASARSLGSHKKIHFKHSSLDSAGTRRSSFQTSTIVATDTFTGSDRSFQRLAQRQTDVEFAVNLNDEKDKWERASSISIEKKEKGKALLNKVLESVRINGKRASSISIGEKEKCKALHN